jgi:hypothetical protein
MSDCNNPMEDDITPVQTPRVHIKQCEADVARCPAQNDYPSREQPQHRRRWCIAAMLGQRMPQTPKEMRI